MAKTKTAPSEVVKQLTGVVFNNEHLADLKSLYTELSFSGEVIDGQMGANKLTPYDILHNASITSLQGVYTRLKKNIEGKNDLDEWSMTAYQQKQIKMMENWKQFVHLMIGYKKYQAEHASNSEKKRELNAKLKTLQEDLLTPQQKLDALQAEIDALG